MTRKIRQFYRENPLMVSSPFGGVDRVDRALIDEVFRSLAIEVRGKRVLDVGCGRGMLREAVEAGGGQYVGADLLANAGGFRLVLGDAQHLPFADETFDAVFCIDAFEHIPDGERAAREFRRLLRPGGFVFLSAPNYGNVAGLVKWWCEHFGGYPRNTWAPFRRWQAQELEQPLTGRRVKNTFERAGFRVARRIGHAREAGLGLFPWVDHPRMPEALQFRLQRLFAWIGPAVVVPWPGASLHGFWRFDVRE